MTDFAKTMKDWRKMCKIYFTRFGRCCNGCPLDDLVEGNCGSIYQEYFADAVDWEELEKRIDAWTAENPEPVYPTWVEWFRQEEIAPPDQKVFHSWLFSPISHDIAKKLGIRPKEGTYDKN